LSDYATRLMSVNAAYTRNLKSWYGLERRWLDHAFWQRRQTVATWDKQSRTSLLSMLHHDPGFIVARGEVSGFSEARMHFVAYNCWRDLRPR
jgi:hypothetical protein